MALPRNDLYNEAVQNPLVVFSDTDLKFSTAETYPSGLPKPYSGGFTVTFKLISKTNSWAVRCMIRQISELEKRYQAITSFFSTYSSKYFIEAKYLPNGIRVNGTFYPIIKMKWMEGEPINIYLSRHYNNRFKVEKLLGDFQNMISELEKLGIAHGDLQHGNIIVHDDKLCLIDYDGIYLPSLSGLPSNEIGHQNFQHPQRTGKDFNPKIDRFSSIVIFLALKAIIYKPSLWTKYDNSDNLLLKSQDIADLKNSQLIADLTRIPELKIFTERFVGVCHLDFGRVPSLKDFINGDFAYDKSNIGKIEISRSQYDVLDAKLKGRILEHFGEKVEVVGLITNDHSWRTSNGKPCHFLNAGRYGSQTFTITIWSEGLNSLREAGIGPSSFVKKWISIIGVVTSYNGVPQIVIEQASQIQILSGEIEANQRLKLKPQQKNAPIAPTIKRVEDKEAKTFNELYKDRPVYTPPKPIVTTPTKTNNKPPATYSSSSQTTKQATTSPKNNTDNSGCVIPIIFAIIGAILIGAASDGKLWFLGAIGGGILGVWIQDWFKS